MTKTIFPARAPLLMLAMLLCGQAAGCALMQPPLTVASPAVPLQSQQIAAALESITEVLAQLKATQAAPATAPAPANPSLPAAPALSADKESQLLALLTTAMQQLNTSLQSAPTTQAQQQAAFTTGIQTAQSAAVTFGGQYGALIAAGLGILSVLIQGMANTSKAHQTAQSANATAQTLAGRLPPIPHQP